MVALVLGKADCSFKGVVTWENKKSFAKHFGGGGNTMSRSNDAGHFFQTSDALATNERKAAKAKNKYGNPIKLPSKVLAACADPTTSEAVYVAEAAGEVKRVTLEVCKSILSLKVEGREANATQTNEVERIFSQGTAPLTCLAITADNRSLFAGSWDKKIYGIQLSSKQLTERLSGHTDFVKCLLTTSLNGKPILISGGADAAIIVWDIESGKQLHKLKGHTKSLQDLAIDPLSLDEGTSELRNSFILFTGSSDREIRRWHISLDSAYELPESIERPILAHDTSVYKLRFDSEGDLWTASADNTAKHLVRDRHWESDTVLQHHDFVRDVIISEEFGLVVTACRDEEVRVWHPPSEGVVCVYSGHFEEVAGLVLIGRSVVSVSIDGTIRRWGLSRQDMEWYQEELKKEANGAENAAGEAKRENMLTAEEEAELAELMDDDD